MGDGRLAWPGYLVLLMLMVTVGADEALLPGGFWCGRPGMEVTGR